MPLFCKVCKTREASFKYDYENKAEYCKGCAEPEMVDIKHIKCKVCKIRRPNFNYDYENKAEYCKGCSEPDMVDVVNIKCKVCKIRRPNFNYEYEGKGEYCKTCAEPDMVDVNSNKCTFPNCYKNARYGIPCNKPTKCSIHIEENMMFKPRKQCEMETCHQVATFSNIGKIPMRCEIHKIIDDIMVVERICVNCGNVDILSRNGKCIHLCEMIEQFKNIKKYNKVYEERILHFLKTHYLLPNEYSIKIDFACGGKHSEVKEIGYDFKTHKVYIEVDENQHKSYCDMGEFNRMKNIYFNEGGIPTVFIRYNPNKYKDIRCKKKRKLTVNMYTQSQKEEKLLKWIKYYETFSNVPYNLSVHYLFYDNHNHIGNTLFEIPPYENHQINGKECQICKSVFYIDAMYEKHKQLH